MGRLESPVQVDFGVVQGREGVLVCEQVAVLVERVPLVVGPFEVGLYSQLHHPPVWLEGLGVSAHLGRYTTLDVHRPSYGDRKSL